MLLYRFKAGHDLLLVHISRFWDLKRIKGTIRFHLSDVNPNNPSVSKLYMQTADPKKWTLPILWSLMWFTYIEQHALGCVFYRFGGEYAWRAPSLSSTCARKKKRKQTPPRKKQSKLKSEWKYPISNCLRHPGAGRATRDWSFSAGRGWWHHIFPMWKRHI